MMEGEMPFSCQDMAPTAPPSDPPPGPPPGMPPPPGPEDPEVAPSVGSALHASGECQPCAWFWKPTGCQNGAVCNRCHLCPQGAVKARKRAKHAMMRLNLATQKSAAEDETSPCAGVSEFTQGFSEFAQGEPACVAFAAEGPLPEPGEASLVDTLPSSPPPPPPMTELLLPAAVPVPREAPPEPPASYLEEQLPTTGASSHDLPLGDARGRGGHVEPMPPGLALPPGTPSRGSVLHGAGNCQPCAWFWKPGSCQNGGDCRHCHLCPEGEIKARKRQKLSMMRLGLVTPPAGAQVSFGMDEPDDDDDDDLEQADLLQDPSGPSSAERDLPSRGSDLHGSGTCQPCAWFWKRGGCHNALECSHCHLCPEGEIKARKKKKMADMRSGGAATPSGDTSATSRGNGLALPGVTPRNRTGSDSDHASTTASGSGSDANGLEDGVSASPTAKSCIGVEIPLPPGLRAPPGTPSHGSLLHTAGNCQPCPWFWASTGCPNAHECGYCHLCPREASSSAAKKKRDLMRLGVTPKAAHGNRSDVEAACALLSLASLTASEDAGAAHA